MVNVCTIRQTCELDPPIIFTSYAYLCGKCDMTSNRTFFPERPRWRQFTNTWTLEVAL